MGQVSVTEDDVTWLQVHDHPGDGRVRRAAVALAERLGFGEARTGEVAIVATELTTNLARHAGGGAVAVCRLGGERAAGIGLLAIDDGPGIADVAAAMADGSSTAATLGIGLGAIDRLSTTAELYSSPSGGTVVHATIWRDGVPPEEPQAAGLVRPMANETLCGDAALVLGPPGPHLLVLADGLGHGPLAARASRAALQVVRDEPRDDVVGLLQAMHRSLGRTRGAAVAVAAPDPAGGTVRFAGVGNVAAWVVTHDGRKGMPSQPGIVGSQLPKTVREQSFPLPPGALVVLHSDGLTDRWDAARYPGVHGRAPAVLAGLLLRDAGVRHDDAAVLVARVAVP